LAVDEDQAGNVAECDNCGAKFRVPTPKRAGARKTADDEDEDKVAAGPPPRRKRKAAEDVDDRPRRRVIRDEDDEDEDDDDREKPKRPTHESAHEALMMKIRLSAIAVLLLLAVVFGGLFVRGFGVKVFFVSYAVGFSCAIMAARMATNEGGTTSGLCVLFGIMTCLAALGAILNMALEVNDEVKYPYSLLFFMSTFFWSSFLALYVVPHWQQARTFGICWCLALFLCIISLVTVLINYDAIQSRRDEKWKEIKPSQTKVVPEFEWAGLRGNSAQQADDVHSTAKAARMAAVPAPRRFHNGTELAEAGLPA
jgi:hypothetical protein